MKNWGEPLRLILWRTLAASVIILTQPALAQDIESVVVSGRAENLTGIAAAASEGTVSAADLALRPLLRPGEVAEEIPGVIITQHSGSGKANQYFLRGFNLDHGTDLAVSVDGMPVNMPSHAHGQGYADLNFLIPELVERVEYKKGPYYADVGDFGSAGAFNIRYFEQLPAGLARLESGEVGYGRGLLAGNAGAAGGALLYALELEHNDGPWVRGDDERKINGVLRYARESDQGGWTISAMGYHNIWNSTDQIPARAIPPFSRWGSIDNSDGGKTGRYSVDVSWHQAGPDSGLRASAYAVYYNLDLFSDFTYFLNDPLHGDQIEQTDNRYIFGGKVMDNWNTSLFGFDSETSAGLTFRHDAIHNGLFNSARRTRLSATSVNSVAETTISPYVENQTHWTSWLRTVVGVRADAYFMDVTDLLAGTRTQVDAQIFSPKFNVILGPWASTELYLDFGQGFHSNDARGVTAAASPATALPRSTGYEAGLRTTIIPGLRTELSLWQLDLQSELVWAGDAGTNEPSGPTRRYGVEFANWYTPTPWLTLDADYAWSHSRFTDFESDGPYVPEALMATFDGGVALHDLPDLGGLSLGLRLRYFGPRPLTQDNKVQSRATTLLYANAGYDFDNWSLGLDVFNLLDARDSDIDYFYTSRLPGEPLAGVDDIHTHPSEPREFRFSLTRRF